MNAHKSSLHKGHLWSFDINAFLEVVCRHYFYYLSLPRNDMKCTESSSALIFKQISHIAWKQVSCQQLKMSQCDIAAPKITS